MSRFSIPTATILNRQNNLINRRRRAADRVVVAMRDRGLALHLSHEKSGDIWWLSDGTPVTAATAKLAAAHPHVIGVGGGLFRDALGQTFRHI